ncbi:LptF/LptG family permease [Pseudomonas aeruginosa]
MVTLDRYIGVTVCRDPRGARGDPRSGAAVRLHRRTQRHQRSYGIGDALRFHLLTAPRRAYDMPPMAALIGRLVGLGTLASNSELTIMRAAGVSLSRIVWAVMKPMLVLMLAGILVGEYVAPWTENIARAAARPGPGRRRFAKLQARSVARQGREYIHINAVQPNGVLYGVTRYRFRRAARA